MTTGPASGPGPALERPAGPADPTGPEHPSEQFTLPGLPVPGLPIRLSTEGPPDEPGPPHQVGMSRDGSETGPGRGRAATGDASTRPRRIGWRFPTERVESVGRGARRAVAVWTGSLRLRVIVLTLLLSSLVMVAVGVAVQQQITSGLLDSKLNAAIGEIESARVRAEVSLDGAETDATSLRSSLNNTLTDLSRTGGAAGAQGSTAGVFIPVIIPSRNPELAVGDHVADVPADLQEHVMAGNLSWRYTSVHTDDGATVPALVVGAPATTDTGTFGVYLIFLLAGEQSSIAVVQNTLLLGGAALAVALAAIAALVASQAVRPVRRAALVAQRFAAGSLDERMPVKGPNELVSLATSFNGMAEAIRAQIRQLEEFGRLQRRFTSDVSHELRTPVTTVRMAADLLHGEREEFPPHLARATELLTAELDRFETLLADLLEISRHDAGMAELSAEAVDVRSHVATCVAAADPLAANAGVRIDVQMPATPVVAEIDARRFERILRNLINNAIDHADGGDVEVRVATDDQAMAVTVTDHGVGLKPGEAGLVFNRFWRADPSRQRQTGGTGLGLAISLEDARLHGGWLQASGTPGVGARFRLTLPLARGVLVTSSPLPLALAETRPDEPAAAEPGAAWVGTVSTGPEPSGGSGYGARGPGAVDLGPEAPVAADGLDGADAVDRRVGDRR